MGEIGISPDRFRYGLRGWEARSIIRGYNRRARHLWSATRWQTYNLMCVQAGKSMSENGINRPQDLLKFHWDREYSPLTEDEIKELQQDMQNFKFS